MKQFKLLTILTVIISTVAFTACSGGASPSSVIEKSYDLMKAKQYEDVVKLYIKKDGEKLSEDEAKKVEGLLGMGMAELEKKDGIKSITIDNEEISEDGNSAEVDFTVSYGNGTTNKENEELIKVDGKWYIIFGMN